MFDVRSSDLLRAPAPYAALNGSDVFAKKVKLASGLPWLEIVCGAKAEEDIFFLTGSQNLLSFSEEEVAQRIASMCCRMLEKETGRLSSLELSQVVALGDGVTVRYRTCDGHLLHPLTMETDELGQSKAAEVLLEVNPAMRKKRKEHKQT